MKKEFDYTLVHPVNIYKVHYKTKKIKEEKEPMSFAWTIENSSPIFITAQDIEEAVKYAVKLIAYFQSDKRVCPEGEYITGVDSIAEYTERAYEVCGL